MEDMGEKQIRAHAEQVGIEALRPLFDSLAELTAAAEAAGAADELRAAARVRAQQLLDDAEAQIELRQQRWREAWAAARAAGWTTRRLRAAPINQSPPPAVRTKTEGRQRRERPPDPTWAPSNGSNYPANVDDKSVAPEELKHRLLRQRISVSPGELEVGEAADQAITSPPT
jgi:hypothetical protein